jgi:hypothetical protein
LTPAFDTYQLPKGHFRQRKYGRESWRRKIFRALPPRITLSPARWRGPRPCALTPSQVLSLRAEPSGPVIVLSPPPGKNNSGKIIHLAEIPEYFYFPAFPRPFRDFAKRTCEKWPSTTLGNTVPEDREDASILTIRLRVIPLRFQSLSEQNDNRSCLLGAEARRFRGFGVHSR